MSRPARRGLAVASSSAALLLALAACGSGVSDDAEGAAEQVGPGYVTEGKLTVGTAQPAYFPWAIDDDPTTGEGFEPAVAYAVAEQLGFDSDDVEWVRTTFDEAIAPGPKTFDINLQQFSITPERENAVDFSSPYYESAQVVVTTGSSSVADAASLADLEDALIGAQTGTTSFIAAEQTIAPAQGVQAFSSNDDAKLALENGQVDAIVVDLPTAFYISGAELDDGVIVGQLPEAEGQHGDAFGIVLPKGSALTGDVTDAVDALREDGTLDALAEEWLGGDAAPQLQ
ncbi:ABC transporter substrate-binding protein [Microbacterium sp. gxy059]|uniref:ABC transporter substrate-binding protein n=1 Tax=Microbacterium sp. gxy059 TaxID=2957199 RepID=UPI003D996504